MYKKYRYYFKVLNHQLFGGEGSEGFMALGFYDKQDNPVEVLKDVDKFTDDPNVKYLEITEKEYLELTEE
ncbi:MAG: hypothetical protein ACRCX8_12465 [Sarcina sp.]